MNYQIELEKARQSARDLFLAENKLYEEIICLVKDFLPEIAFEIEQEIKLDKYVKPLLASFVRTAFVSVELIMTSELVEAVTLNRKQLELLARLYETQKKPFEELDKKTPNLSHLKSKIKKRVFPNHGG